MTIRNIVEATIDELQALLSSGALTSVQLVALYLCRICAYDCNGPSLNSIPVLNENVFDEAAASDDRRAAGFPVRPLEGIPYTVKDSYLVKGMTAACGSPAFAHLRAQEDAFTVSTLRASGAILIGRTNMPPMAYGGMQRGIYGRAESPYNANYLAAAFWSGSSNGSAVATSASFAAFGMGEETVSSGRSPASNNALVAYTPSRGFISIRGNWPLYPTCDVVVPHTRTMRDMLTILDIITVEDSTTQGDFWRNQRLVQLGRPWPERPHSFRAIEHTTSLSGLRIAVPAMYIGGNTRLGAVPVTTCSEVIALWEEARSNLESLGAEVIIVSDFPVVTAYENTDLLPEGCPRLPENWKASERGPLISHGWNEFLQRNNDADFPGISSVDATNIYPESLRTEAELKVIDRSNAIHFSKLSDYSIQPLNELQDLQKALSALEGMRKALLEDWLNELGCHCVAFPAVGDVAAADADTNDASAVYAKTNGVFYSNGNWALRHLGVPTVSVPMGMMTDKQMPMNLTFAGKSAEDVNLLRYAHAYERSTKHRIAPPLTPAIPSDLVPASASNKEVRARRPALAVRRCITHPGSADDDAHIDIIIEGTVVIKEEPEFQQELPSPRLEVRVNGIGVPIEQISTRQISETKFDFSATAHTSKKIKKQRNMAPTTQDKIIVVIMARARTEGLPTGWLGLL